MHLEYPIKIENIRPTYNSAFWPPGTQKKSIAIWIEIRIAFLGGSCKIIEISQNGWIKSYAVKFKWLIISSRDGKG